MSVIRVQVPRWKSGGRGCNRRSKCTMILDKMTYLKEMGKNGVKVGGVVAAA